MHALHHQDSMHVTAQSHFGNKNSYQLICNTFAVQGHILMNIWYC